MADAGATYSRGAKAPQGVFAAFGVKGPKHYEAVLRALRGLHRKTSPRRPARGRWPEQDASLRGSVPLKSSRRRFVIRCVILPCAETGMLRHALRAETRSQGRCASVAGICGARFQYHAPARVD